MQRYELYVVLYYYIKMAPGDDKALSESDTKLNVCGTWNNYYPDSKVHGVNMGPMNLAISVYVGEAHTV